MIEGKLALKIAKRLKALSFVDGDVLQEYGRLLSTRCDSEPHADRAVGLILERHIEKVSLAELLDAIADTRTQKRRQCSLCDNTGMVRKFFLITYERGITARKVAEEITKEQYDALMKQEIGKNQMLYDAVDACSCRPAFPK